ncbi:hypothetical protein EDD85DRAFT_952421 [Armillaria nabsnona]|nr:hypothetical protein EDD85DRAFT_952421 [Armillaria nabsnona]
MSKDKHVPSNGKGKPKNKEPLFYSSESKGPADSIPPLLRFLVTLWHFLGMNSSILHLWRLTLKLPWCACQRLSHVSASDINVSEPDDLMLRVMLPKLMEAHLNVLGAYLGLLSLGKYCIVIPISCPPDDFDLSTFHLFDVIAKFF